MSNTRVEYLFTDLSPTQLAPSEANRVVFAAGKTTGRKGDMNWELDFKIPTGIPVVDQHTKTYSRVILTGRNTVCDQVLVNVPEDPINTTQINDGRNERNSGSDHITA